MAELDWFDIQAASRGVSRRGADARHPRLSGTAVGAGRGAIRAGGRRLVGAGTGLSGGLALRRVVRGAGPYAAAVAHWTGPAFASYVAALEELADAALTQETDDAVEDVVGAVLAHEVAFWDMAERGTGEPRSETVGRQRRTCGRALAHPFVRGLADGSLPRQVFSGYVAQDAFFLEAFARAYALALAASPDTVHRARVRRLDRRCARCS